MQLPRGTFREIRKGETIDNLIAELERSRFSGITSISSPAGTGTLVIKGGKTILVKFLGKSGDAGWDALMANPGEEVDAALSSLDDAQIQLSLEFNKPCRITRLGKPASGMAKPSAPQPRVPVKKPAPPVRAAGPAHAAQPPAKSPSSSLFNRPAPPAEPAAPVPKQPFSPSRPAMPAPPTASGPQKTAGADERADGATEDSSTNGSFESDIDTFDSMDLDNVTDKIRNDVKTMIKQLHLEHLMER